MDESVLESLCLRYEDALRRGDTTDLRALLEEVGFHPDSSQFSHSLKELLVLKFVHEWRHTSLPWLGQEDKSWLETYPDVCDRAFTVAVFQHFNAILELQTELRRLRSDFLNHLPERLRRGAAISQ